MYKVYNIQIHIGLNLLTILRLELSHLNDHRSKHTSQNCINPLCTYSLEFESHFFLHCRYYHNTILKLLNSIELMKTNLLKLPEQQLIRVCLYGFYQPHQNQNRNILNFSIGKIIELKSFESCLFVIKLSTIF